MAAGSYKGSYKMDDSFSSSDESGQDDERTKAAAGVRSLKTDKVVTFTFVHLSGENNFYRETYDQQPEAIGQRSLADISPDERNQMASSWTNFGFG